MSSSKAITILGAGAWGSALALHLARCQQTVRLWDINNNHLTAIVARHGDGHHELQKYITVTDNLATAITGVRDILSVLPSHAFAKVLSDATPYFSKRQRLVWASKGFDPGSCRLLSEVAHQLLGAIPLAVLSGPSFAKEVAAGMPTMVVVASRDEKFSQSLINRFSARHFNIEKSDDIIGVQVAAALKNIYAIIAGVSDGLGFGSNCRCGLVTRGLAEMLALGMAMGAREKTFMGLAGLGDLMLTCGDNQSRNRRFGLALGQGQSVAQARQTIKQVIEGENAAKQALILANRFSVNMPIAKQVVDIISARTTPLVAMESLL